MNKRSEGSQYCAENVPLLRLTVETKRASLLTQRMVRAVQEIIVLSTSLPSFIDKETKGRITNQLEALWLVG